MVILQNNQIRCLGRRKGTGNFYNCIIIMKYTKYGLMAAIGSISALSIMPLNKQILILIAVSIIIQATLCKGCNSSYNMVSFISVFPLLCLIFTDCKDIYKIVIAFSIAAAIGRVGCYFAGCCSGHEVHDPDNELHIKYSGDSVINQKLNKEEVYVKPTIILEIVLQTLIVMVLFKSKQPLILFGILNALLIFMTNKWRYGGRASEDSLYKFSILSLLLFSLISYFKCMGNYKEDIKIKVTKVRLIIGIILGFILSNDINLKDIKLDQHKKNTY